MEKIISSALLVLITSIVTALLLWGLSFFHPITPAILGGCAFGLVIGFVGRVLFDLWRNHAKKNQQAKG